MSDVSEICSSALINNWIHAHCEFKSIPLCFFKLPSKTTIHPPGFPWKPLIRFQNTSKQCNPSLEMFSWLPRKPVSCFGSRVDGMRFLCQEQNGIWKFLKGGLAPSMRVLRCFHPSAPLDSVHSPPVRGPPTQDKRAACSKVHHPHSSPSSCTAGDVNLWKMCRWFSVLFSWFSCCYLGFLLLSR